MPKVSIVISCYNYGNYLSRALESALAQTHQDLQVILINDGSTDDTDAVARRFLERDSRGVYIAQKNGGQANAKNTGIRAATGEFVAFLDADDVWEPSKLEKQLRLFADPSIGVVYSRVRFIAPNGRPSILSSRELPRFRGNVVKPLLRDNFVPFSSALVRRECFAELGMFDESLPMSIDWDLWLRFALRYRFDYVDEPLLFYREGHPGQMSKNLLLRQVCCDRLFSRFVAANRSRIDPADVRQAKIYTYNSRGYFFRHRDPPRSLRYYGLSLREDPFQWRAAKGLALSALWAVGKDWVGLRAKIKPPVSPLRREHDA